MTTYSTTQHEFSADLLGRAPWAPVRSMDGDVRLMITIHLEGQR